MRYKLITAGLCSYLLIAAPLCVPSVADEGDKGIEKSPRPNESIELPGERFTVASCPAFVFLPPEEKRSDRLPWVFYAPLRPRFPVEAERWMLEQFLNAGVAVAGVDVGEAYGSPQSLVVFDALYDELTQHRGFARGVCLYGRSRGGLWASSWALAHPERVTGLIGIFPALDLRIFPGLARAARAYQLSTEELQARSAESNPIERCGVLAKAGVPVILIHGLEDKVIPIESHAREFVRRYREANPAARVRLIEVPEQGHSYFPGFFESQEIADFGIERARAGQDVK